MTALGGAGDGLLAALATGLFALLLAWYGRRGNNDRMRSAWQAQAERLRDELRGVYEKQIEYLEGQCSAKDSEITRKADEIRRLNRLLNKRGGGEND